MFEGAKKRIADQAKKVTNEAGKTVDTIRDEATNAVTTFVDETKQSVTEKVDHLKTITSFDQVAKEMIRKAEEVIPYIEKSGYDVENLVAEISVPPRMTLECQLEKVISMDEKEAILNGNDGTLTKVVVDSLLKLSNSNFNQLHNYVITGVEVELTAIPAVRVRYRREDV